MNNKKISIIMMWILTAAFEGSRPFMLAMMLNLTGVCWVGTLVGVWIWWMMILARCGIVLVYFRSLLLVVIVIMGCGVNLVVHDSCSMVLANLHSLWVPITD